MVAINLKPIADLETDVTRMSVNKLVEVQASQQLHVHGTGDDQTTAIQPTVMNVSHAGAAILSAALLLPMPSPVHAEAPPERPQVSFKYLDYLDSQPGADRVHVRAPAVNVVVPFAGDWALNATYINDAISGASPYFHTRSLTKLHDVRRAIDARLTRYFDQGTLTAGVSYSKESDYLSRGLLLQGTLSTEDQNTTLNAGVAVSNDEINPTNRVVVNEHKRVTEWNLGVTQVLSKWDLTQLNIGYADGHGYFTDPYKLFDARPDERQQHTVMVRWNHHLDVTQGTTRTSYRYYHDNFGIKAHTLNIEYVQPLPYGWTITPLLRLYTQTAASFYLDVDPAFPNLPVFPTTTFATQDQRLSAFGARTLGVKVTKAIGDDWLVDMSYEDYAQRSEWAVSGNSPGLAPFYAESLMFGVTKKF